MKILTALLLISIITILASAELITFGEKAVDAIFKQKRDSFILFCQPGEAGDNAKTIVEEVAASDDVHVYSVLNSEQNADHYKRFAEYLGIDVSETPKLILLKQARNKFIASAEDITAQGIPAFAAKVLSGEVKPYLKSAPVPADNDKPVKTLVGSTFKDLVYGSEVQYLVKIYAPWCGHCKKIAPEYEKAAQAISNNPNIVLADFDGTLNEVEGLQISGYPTIYFFGKDKTVDPIQFNGGRDAAGIIDWLKDHTTHDWVDPLTVVESTGQEEL